MLTSFTALDNRLHRGDKPVPSRKIANNTHAQRRGPDAIAIKLHDTDVVTHHRNGSITLDSGEWYTCTTRDRMNTFTPRAVQVFTDKGRWMLTHLAKTNGLPIYEAAVPYLDGIVLRPLGINSGSYHVEPMNPVDLARQDAHNAHIQRMISKYLRNLTEPLNLVQPSSVAVCPLCILLPREYGRPTRLVGEAMGDTQHLIEHMIDKVYPPGLLIHATEQSNPHGRPLANLANLGRVKSDLRTYLRSALIVGPISIRGGHRARSA